MILTKLLDSFTNYKLKSKEDDPVGYIAKIEQANEQIDKN